MVNSTGGTLEEVNIQGLQPGTTYMLRVVAMQEGSVFSTSSDPLSIRTQDEVDVPGPVSHLRARPTSACCIRACQKLLNGAMPLPAAIMITFWDRNRLRIR